jgi:wobble nucleotide-excising tRNase
MRLFDEGFSNLLIGVIYRSDVLFWALGGGIMVRTLQLLRNVGKFDNVGAGASLPFSKLTVIYAENGRGKTTLAAILRSLSLGRGGPILERRRLGAQHAPHVVIDVDGGLAAVFQNGVWTRTAPEITIFDDNFVAENVCSGIEVASTHRQNLHELIIGAQGLALNTALQAEVDKIEVHNRELRDRENAIPAHSRGGLDVDTFCALGLVAGLPRLIDEAERRLAAAREAGRIAETATFPAISLPTINLDEVESILGRDLLDIDADALGRVRAHLSRLGRGGEAWVSEGMVLVDNLAGQEHADCPFCAQGLAGSPVLNHYRTYFGVAYNGLKTDIATAIRTLVTAHGGDVPSAFERTVRQAVECYAFWKDFASVPPVEIDTAKIALAWREARDAVQGLLEAKREAPLDKINIPDEVRQKVVVHNTHCSEIEVTASGIIVVNAALDLVKEQARDANVATLSTDLEHLRAVEARHDAAMTLLCEAYLAEKTAKAATERARHVARAALDSHRQNAFPAYGVAINDFLQRFNATFRVGPVDAVSNRGGSAANYSLVIDGNPVPLSSSDGDQCFRNTLSAGDRNTLALAFFFASLENDPDRARKIVVIDDPMTSLDEHRTLHTLQEIDRLSREVTSVIVLSHSKPFLLGVWDKCQQIPKTALEVRRMGTGSTLANWDVTAAMVTEHDRRHAAALVYLQHADPTTERRVAESLRPMLEAFARVAYPPDFPPGTLLGSFHAACVRRQGGLSEIMSAANARELREILDFANRYHHETNAAYATELINDAELTDFTRRTLAFIRRP